MKPILSGVALSALLLATVSAEARVCLVHDFDMTGCQKGEQILFLPQKWGSEQLPIDFIATNCDLEKPFAHTNGAVTCFYSGPKNFVDLAKEREQKAANDALLAKQAPYKALYEAALANPNEWMKIKSFGGDWLVRLDKQKLPNATGQKVKVGDRIAVYAKVCRHDPDGTEHLDPEFRFAGETDVPDDKAFFERMDTRDGMVFEFVSSTEHGFMGYKIVKDKPKANTPAKQK